MNRPAKRLKILIVDDSAICLAAVSAQLEDRGYEVVALGSPFGFGAALTRERPDLVLVDSNMPALSGDKLILIAKKNNLCSCPMVLHADAPERELHALTVASGASGFIQKTDDGDGLARAIERFLKERRD